MPAGVSGMSRSSLFAIELSLVGAAALIVFLILGPSSNGGPAPRGPDDEAAAATAGDAGAIAFVGATPAPDSPARTPQHDRCGPPLTPDFFERNQVLSYYGNPYTADMGILGEVEPEELVAQLQEHAAEYDALNGDLGVRPALHLVWATAQDNPGREGNYLLYVDRETMEEFIDLACRSGMFIFIDLQIGHSNVAAEVEKALPFLEDPHVQLALDPEFAMSPGEVPGEAIGTIDAEDVNTAQRMVADFVKERRLPDKILVVHQFLESMITRPDLLDRYPGVRLAIDMDGFGPAEIKRVKYGWFAAPADYSAIKLFFKQDPDLMSESDVLSLGPDIIIYQ